MTPGTTGAFMETARQLQPFMSMFKVSYHVACFVNLGTFIFLLIPKMMLPLGEPV